MKKRKVSGDTIKPAAKNRQAQRCENSATELDEDGIRRYIANSRRRNRVCPNGIDKGARDRCIQVEQKQVNLLARACWRFDASLLII